MSDGETRQLPKVVHEPAHKDIREWVHGDVKIIQRAVGSQMEKDGKVWFWCQTWTYSNDSALNPIFAFVEKVFDPTAQRYRGTYKELAEALFKRGRGIAERVLDDSLIQDPPWDDEKPLKYRVEVLLSELSKLPESLADYGFKKP